MLEHLKECVFIYFVSEHNKYPPFIITLCNVFYI